MAIRKRFDPASAPVVVALLRGINVGKHHRIKMEDLRTLYMSLGCRNPQTFIQSGNVVFRGPQESFPELALRLEEGFEKAFGFRSGVVLRTANELRGVLELNPFAGNADLDGSKLLVVFLSADPGEAAREAVRRIAVEPEELRTSGRELYVYFPSGMARTKLQLPALERALGCVGTGRNLNSVEKLVHMAEAYSGD